MTRIDHWKLNENRSNAVQIGSMKVSRQDWGWPARLLIAPRWSGWLKLEMNYEIDKVIVKSLTSFIQISE